MNQKKTLILDTVFHCPIKFNCLSFLGFSPFRGGRGHLLAYIDNFLV